jgi:hypothetical protein
LQTLPIEKLVIEFKEYKNSDGKEVLIYNVTTLIEGTLITLGKWN